MPLSGETAAEMDLVLHLPEGGARGSHAKLAGRLVPPTVRDGYGHDAKQVPAFELHFTPTPGVSTLVQGILEGE
mgnify:CR=1 FL=1